MQITDEMVRIALDLQHQDGTSPEDAMRAALEAALGARSENAATIVMLLRMACGYEDVTDEVRKSCSHASNGLVIDAAACIEDLAAVLKEVISVSDLATDIYDRARTTLERWGLK